MRLFGLHRITPSCAFSYVPLTMRLTCFLFLVIRVYFDYSVTRRFLPGWRWGFLVQLGELLIPPLFELPFGRNLALTNYLLSTRVVFWPVKQETTMLPSFNEFWRRPPRVSIFSPGLVHDCAKSSRQYQASTGVSCKFYTRSIMRDRGPTNLQSSPAIVSFISTKKLGQTHPLYEMNKFLLKWIFYYGTVGRVANATLFSFFLSRCVPYYHFLSA